MEIWRLLPIEGVGLYVGKDMINRSGVRDVRLSLDGMHIWKEQLTERIFILTEEAQNGHDPAGSQERIGFLEKILNWKKNKLERLVMVLFQ